MAYFDSITPIAQEFGYFVHNGDIPAADEQRCNRGDIRIETRIQAALDAADESLGHRQVLEIAEPLGNFSSQGEHTCISVILEAEKPGNFSVNCERR
jgi:hypothetical protein